MDYSSQSLVERYFNPLSQITTAMVLPDIFSESNFSAAATFFPASPAYILYKFIEISKENTTQVNQVHRYF